jgi:hypothetical protein
VREAVPLSAIAISRWTCSDSARCCLSKGETLTVSVYPALLLTLATRALNQPPPAMETRMSETLNSPRRPVCRLVSNQDVTPLLAVKAN